MSFEDKNKKKKNPTRGKGGGRKKDRRKAQKGSSEPQKDQSPLLTPSSPEGETPSSKEIKKETIPEVQKPLEKKRDSSLPEEPSEIEEPRVEVPEKPSEIEEPRAEVPEKPSEIEEPRAEVPEKIEGEKELDVPAPKEKEPPKLRLLEKKTSGGQIKRDQTNSERVSQKHKGDVNMSSPNSETSPERRPLHPAARIAIGLVVAFLLFYVSIWKWVIERVYVPPEYMMVLNLKIGDPNKDPENLRVVPENTQGIQKEVMGEGRYFYNPIFYDRIVRSRVIEIGLNEVGIVTSKSGQSLPPNEFLTKKIEGEKGIWERVLTPGKWRLNPFAFKVEKRSIIDIPPGFVGCVTAKAGIDPRETPEEYLLEAYGLFQKLEKTDPSQREELDKLFVHLAGIYKQMSLPTPWLSDILDREQIRNLWEFQKKLKLESLSDLDRQEMGRSIEKSKQEALAGLKKKFEEIQKSKGLDRYYRSLFLMRSYKTLDKEEIPELVEDFKGHEKTYRELIEKISKDSKAWKRDQEAFQVALQNADKAFNGEILSKRGEKGIQEEVLQPGIYYINPHKYQVDVVEVGYRQFSSEGVQFPSKDGFPLTLDISAIWGLLPGDVPYLIKKYGNVTDIDQKVIQPQVENICKNFGSKYEAKKFIEGATRKEFQRAFTQELERVCKTRRIDILLGLVRDIQVPEQVRRPIQIGKIADLEREMKIEQQETQKVKNQLVELEKEVIRGVRNIEAETQKDLANIKANTEKEVAEISAETEVKVAKIMKEVAKWNALKDQTLGEAEAEVIKMVKTAEADKLRQNVRALGGSRAYANYIFTQNLPPNFRIFIRYAGPGTFWTDLPKALKSVEKAASLKILSGNKSQ